MGVRTLTCLFGVHSSVPAGPVSDPFCTRPRLVWYWTFPSGSPPVFSTTSTCPPPHLSPVIFSFSLHCILSVSSRRAHASLIFIPPYSITPPSRFSLPLSPNLPQSILCVQCRLHLPLLPLLLFVGLLPSFSREPSLWAPAATLCLLFPPLVKQCLPSAFFF